MAKFRFYKDEKVTAWERTCFVIEAETAEQAEELARRAISEDVEEIGSYDYSEFLSECTEYNTHTPTRVSATVEILNSEFESIIDDRIKIDGGKFAVFNARNQFLADFEALDDAIAYKDENEPENEFWSIEVVES